MKRAPPSSFPGMPDLPKPQAPFISRVPSAASLPRSPSAQSFRAPFLAPSSRPSSLWSPPSHPNLYAAALPRPRPPLPSTALTHPPDKPWLTRTQPGTRSSYALTLAFVLLGTLAAALIAFIGYSTVPLLPDRSLCLVLDEQFSASALDDSIWNYDLEPDDLGFQTPSNSPNNLYLSNSNLYIVPTLDSSQIGSARINTKSKKSIRFGRVAIRAKLPSGDWLHPRIYLLPESDDPYGPFPASGFIDILNARGNDITYPAQGANVVRAALGYGPLLSVQNHIFGWVARKRRGVFAHEFHLFVLEWDQHFIRVYLDKRTQPMLEIPIGPISSNPFSSPSSFYFSPAHKPSFWDKASFPKTVHNSSDGISGPEIVLPNPYQNASDAAPFDQKFYLVVDLGVGGTTDGWFPDGVGGKPWLDGQGRESAITSFQKDQARWFSTWPEVGGGLERAFRIDYIKMWEKC